MKQQFQQPKKRSKKKNSASSEDRNVRARILDRTTELFYSQGVNSTGINQIIKEADVAKDTLYRQFPSKDVLVLKTLEQWGRKLSAIWERKLRRTESPQQLVSRWIKLEKEAIRKEASYNGCPVATIMMEMGRIQDKEIQKTASAIEKRWLAFLEVELHRFRKEGTLEYSGDISDLAREFLVVYQGGLAMWRITGSVRYLDQIQSLFLKLISRART